MIRPDIIGIGGQRCGSTAFYHFLKGHPDVKAEIKEFHYFDELYRVHDLDWYSDHFDENKINIDVTPAYSTLSIGRVRWVHDFTPNSKVVFIVRNPVQRVISAVQFFSMCREDIQDVFDDPDVLYRTLISHAYNPRSDYERTINIWEHVFKDNFRFFYFEDLVDDRKAFKAQLSDFLGIEFKHDIATVNQSAFKFIDARIIEGLIEHFEPKLKMWERLLDPSMIDRWRLDNDAYLQKMRNYHDHISTKQTGIDT